MTSGLSFPINHISVRVPWHDASWNGTVCSDPANNWACLKLPRIAENKNEDSETRIAGRSFIDLDANQLPPCLQERSAFMSPHALTMNHSHPYRRDSQGSHGHFRPTPVHYPPYSMPAVPFRWMIKDSFAGNGIDDLARKYPLDDVNLELEPDLGFNTNWWQDSRNQSALLDCFWSHVKMDESLVFFYAKQVPLLEDIPGRRVLVGVGRVTSIGPLTEYAYDGPVDGKLRSMIWERMVGHSIRTDFSDGFLMPYHEAWEKFQQGYDFDPAELVALAPEDRFTEFSYATEHVGDDSAIEALLSFRFALSRCSELLGTDIRKQEEWIDHELGRLWWKRGPFPGMGAVLSATGVPLGNFVARELENQAGDEESPWSLWFSLLDAPGDVLPPETAKSVDSTNANTWKGMPQERRAFLELISRVDLTFEQAKVLVTPEERKTVDINADDSCFVQNPYLLYESTRLGINPVSINAVDRGMLPAASVRHKFPVPEPSRIDNEVDARRLRALAIRKLEEAAVRGDTLVPRERIIVDLRTNDEQRDEQATLVTGDHFAVAEQTTLGNEVRVVGMADGSPAYQLERLGAASELIRTTVDRRSGPAHHGLAVDWRKELDNVLGELPVDQAEAGLEERARVEKAAALDVLANARLSVLVGSAGTGKTTLVSVLCSHPEIQKGGVVLLAPTGKARVRMDYVISSAGVGNTQAYTLAQFLMQTGRYDATTQRYILTGPQRQSAGRTVVIDECSMLTEEMLAALMASLTQVDRYILVGDSRQLPPIGAGRPFVDIIQRLKPEEFIPGAPHVGPCFAELTVPRRQVAEQRDDLELAQWFGGEPGPSDDAVFEILSGQKQSNTVKVIKWQSVDELKTKLPEVLAEHLEFDEDQDEALEFAKRLGGEMYDDGYVYFHRGHSGKAADDWQILSPSRSKPWGVELLNRLIHQRYKSKQVESATNAAGWRPRFLRPQGNQLIVYGDKVINNRNWRIPKSRKWPEEEGYLANGEIGIVVGQMRTRRFNHTPRHMQMEFSTQPGSVVKFWPTDFDDEHDARLELAYALTVHKAQGSEFDTVFLVLPKSHHMVTREMIYTALTRQKNKIVILMEGTPTDLQRMSSESFSDTASRLTNLFTLPEPVQIGERFLENRLIHRTARGEAVRSKSEVIIANLLHARGIEYRYEEPLEIDGLTKYPDFTIEDDNTGRTYYWEHLGMLSDERYRKRWLEKMEWLKQHDILPQEDGGGTIGTLITTQDSADGGIDSKAVMQLVEELFG